MNHNTKICIEKKVWFESSINPERDFEAAVGILYRANQKYNINYTLETDGEFWYIAENVGTGPLEYGKFRRLTKTKGWKGKSDGNLSDVANLIVQVVTTAIKDLNIESKPKFRVRKPLNDTRDQIGSLLAP